MPPDASSLVPGSPVRGLTDTGISVNGSFGGVVNSSVGPLAVVVGESGFGGLIPYADLLTALADDPSPAQAQAHRQARGEPEPEPDAEPGTEPHYATESER